MTDTPRPPAPPVLVSADQDRLAAAIRQAEAGTAGEIRVVISTRPLIAHPFFGLMWAALLALMLPWPLAIFTRLDTPALLSAQALCFAVAGLILLFTPLAGAVVPRAVREAAARGPALDHFLALGMSATRGRTGVLIFVALPDRVVEVVADAAIHEKVGHDAWGEVCAAVIAGAGSGRLAAGLEAGIAAAGRVLAAHAPAGPDDANELPDRVILL